MLYFLAHTTTCLEFEDVKIIVIKIQLLQVEIFVSSRISGCFNCTKTMVMGVSFVNEQRMKEEEEGDQLVGPSVQHGARIGASF